MLPEKEPIKGSYLQYQIDVKFKTNDVEEVW